MRKVKQKHNARQRKRNNQGRVKMPTSSSSFSARFRSTSSSSLDSAARARDKRTSSSFDRIRHSKCRSRSSYWRRTSFSRSRTLRNNPVRRIIEKFQENEHPVKYVFQRFLRPDGHQPRKEGFIIWAYSCGSSLQHFLSRSCWGSRCSSCVSTTIIWV